MKLLATAVAVAGGSDAVPCGQWADQGPLATIGHNGRPCIPHLCGRKINNCERAGRSEEGEGENERGREREMSGKVRREGEMRREKGWINQRLFVSLRAADVQREQEEAIGGVKGMRGEARTIRKTE